VARPSVAEADTVRLKLDGRSALRLALGFAAAVAFWFVFATPYERILAAAAESLVRVFESPPVTRLIPGEGEIRVERADFPPASPRPGLPTADTHFNFVLLAALFAMAPRPLRPRNFGRFWLAAAGLFIVHAVAILFQVESLYALRLGPWSEAHYGRFAANFWSAGFHFYQVAGRFAAPFALWWLFARPEVETKRR